MTRDMRQMTCDRCQYRSFRAIGHMALILIVNRKGSLYGEESANVLVLFMRSGKHLNKQI